MSRSVGGITLIGVGFLLGCFVVMLLNGTSGSFVDGLGDLSQEREGARDLTQSRSARDGVEAEGETMPRKSAGTVQKSKPAGGSKAREDIDAEDGNVAQVKTAPEQGRETEVADAGTKTEDGRAQAEKGVRADEEHEGRDDDRRDGQSASGRAPYRHGSPGGDADAQSGVALSDVMPGASSVRPEKQAVKPSRPSNEEQHVSLKELWALYEQALKELE